MLKSKVLFLCLVFSSSLTLKAHADHHDSIQALAEKCHTYAGQDQPSLLPGTFKIDHSRLKDNDDIRLDIQLKKNDSLVITVNEKIQGKTRNCRGEGELKFGEKGIEAIGVLKCSQQSTVKMRILFAAATLYNTHCFQAEVEIDAVEENYKASFESVFERID